MEIPDKIYVPIVSLGIEEGEHPAPLWWNKDKKSEHPDVVGTIAYIRKDALLEWAKGKMTIEGATEGIVGGYDLALKDLSKHIESL